MTAPVNTKFKTNTIIRVNFILYPPRRAAPSAVFAIAVLAVCFLIDFLIDLYLLFNPRLLSEERNSTSDFSLNFTISKSNVE